VGAQQYFDEVEIGRRVETPGMTLTDTHLALLCGASGAQLDADASDALALLPLCVSSGLAWRGPGPPLAVLAFMGFEWAFLRRISVGDTIRSRSWTVAKRSLREGGVVVEHREIVNQRDEIVQSGKITLLVAKRANE
jgi:hypothetical protein